MRATRILSLFAIFVLLAVGFDSTVKSPVADFRYVRGPCESYAALSRLNVDRSGWEEYLR